MKEISPSEHEEFFEAPPKPGTPEFREAKKEAGVGDWFQIFSERILAAQEKGDTVLLENSVRAMDSLMVSPPYFYTSKSEEIISYIKNYANEKSTAPIIHFPMLGFDPTATSESRSERMPSLRPTRPVAAYPASGPRRRRQKTPNFFSRASCYS